MQGSPYTLLVYKRAFDGDLMQDLVSAYGQAEYDDLSDTDHDGALTPELSTFLQIAWAMAHTYSDDVPEYPDWLRSFDPREFSLGDSSTLEVIDSAIAAELFRQRQTERGRIRRWLSGALERLAGTARAFAARIRA